MRNKLLKFILVVFTVFSFCGCNEIKEDEVSIMTEKMNSMFYTLFENYDINNITENLILKERIDGCDIIYNSNDERVIANNGVITRGIYDKKTTIDITISNEEFDIKLTKTFVVTVKGVDTIKIKDAQQAVGYYKLQGIVDAICRNSVYMFDDTGITNFIINNELMKKISIGDEIIVTFNKDENDEAVLIDVVSSDNEIRKNYQLNSLDEIAEYKNSRISISNLKVISIRVDLTNPISDFVLRLEGETFSKDLIIDGKILENSENRSLVYDLEVGDVVSLNNVIVDSNLLFYNESDIERVEKKEIEIHSINSILENGNYYISGKVSNVFADFFIFQDETESIIVSNPSDFNVNQGDMNILYVEAKYDSMLNLTLLRVKKCDEYKEYDLYPTYVKGKYLELIYGEEILHPLYAEIVCKVKIVDEEIVMVPQGTEFLIHFEKELDEDLVGKSVHAILYINSSTIDGFNAKLEKIK